mgnify:CR=1 FL=1
MYFDAIHFYLNDVSCDWSYDLPGKDGRTVLDILKDEGYDDLYNYVKNKYANKFTNKTNVFIFIFIIFLLLPLTFVNKGRKYHFLSL